MEPSTIFAPCGRCGVFPGARHDYRCDCHHEARGFYLAWSSVDGAGSQNGYPYRTLEEARDGADRAQRQANRARDDGTGRLYRNPWGYQYTIRNGSHDTVYRARRECGPVEEA
jgi:hypothetical protein